MKITNCQTNHMTNPLGYQLGEPVFSYQVSESQGKKQKQARIRVAQTVDKPRFLIRLQGLLLLFHTVQ